VYRWKFIYRPESSLLGRIGHGRRQSTGVKRTSQQPATIYSVVTQEKHGRNTNPA